MSHSSEHTFLHLLGVTATHVGVQVACPSARERSHFSVLWVGVGSPQQDAYALRKFILVRTPTESPTARIPPPRFRCVPR